VWMPIAAVLNDGSIWRGTTTGAQAGQPVGLPECAISRAPRRRCSSAPDALHRPAKQCRGGAGISLACASRLLDRSIANQNRNPRRNIVNASPCRDPAALMVYEANCCSLPRAEPGACPTSSSTPATSKPNCRDEIIRAIPATALLRLPCVLTKGRHPQCASHRQALPGGPGQNLRDEIEDVRWLRSMAVTQ